MEGSIAKKTLPHHGGNDTTGVDGAICSPGDHLDGKHLSLSLRSVRREVLAYFRPTFWVLGYLAIGHQHGGHFSGGAELEGTRLRVFGYIETLYNSKRLNRMLGYLSPNPPEAEHASASAAKTAVTPVSEKSWIIVMRVT